MDNNTKQQNKILSFKDLTAWQESHKLAIMIYKITAGFPRRPIH